MDIISCRCTQVLLIGIISITFISQTVSRTLTSPTDSNSVDTNNVISANDNEFREQAIGKLRQVFGLENYTGPNEVGSTTGSTPRPRPPPFMLNLYNSVADSRSGITRTPNPFNANTVRAFQDKAAQHWLENQSSNHGIMISVTTLTGEPVEDGIIRFAQRGRHHDTKQPILVMYTNDVTRKTNPRTKFETREPVDYDILLENTGTNDWRQLNSVEESVESIQNGRQNHYSRDRRRERRDAEHTIPSVVPTGEVEEKEENFCQRQSMYVDFEKIGWSSWVISPKGYDAFHCTGTCPFPLGLGHSPSNHATVQSIMHALNLGENMEPPCCVPNSLYAVSLLYFDNDGNVVLKQYADMVAASCRCH